MPNEYNGWKGKGNRASAYATWRVNLELCDDIAETLDRSEEPPDEETLADMLSDQVEELVFMDDPNQEKLVSQYAAAFLDDVNYREIAANILLDWQED